LGALAAVDRVSLAADIDKAVESAAGALAAYGLGVAALVFAQFGAAAAAGACGEHIVDPSRQLGWR